MTAPLTLVSSAYQKFNDYWYTQNQAESTVIIPKIPPVSLLNSPKMMQEFHVVRTNWYWKQQKRILRITSEYLYRLDPDTMEKRATHQLKDINKIIVNSNTITFHFQDGATSESYQCDCIDKILGFFPNQSCGNN